MASLSTISSRAASVAIMLAGNAMPNFGMAQSPSPKPTMDSMIDDILKEKSRPAQQKAPQPAAPKTAPPLAKTATPPTKSADGFDSVRDKIRPCWNTLGNARAVVAVRVEVGPDRVPVKAEIIDKARYKSDADFRMAADAANRAIMNPRCHPWPLPPESYNSWRIITFNFDARDY